jgi:hypothetical protein
MIISIDHLREQIKKYLNEENLKLVQNKSNGVDIYRRNWKLNEKIIDKEYAFSGMCEVRLGYNEIQVIIINDNGKRWITKSKICPFWEDLFNNVYDYFLVEIIGIKILPSYIQHIVIKSDASINDFSLLFGVSPSTIRNWLSGKTSPKSWKKRALFIKMNSWDEQKIKGKIEERRRIFSTISKKFNISIKDILKEVRKESRIEEKCFKIQ